MARSNITSGRLALVATPKFKNRSLAQLSAFVFEFLYLLARRYDVVSTGLTYSQIESIVGLSLPQLREAGALRFIARDLGVEPRTEEDLTAWRSVILKGLSKYEVGTIGLLGIANELVEKRLDGVFHFHDAEDLANRPGSLVLRREANVHDIPIALDLATARELADRFCGDEPVLEAQGGWGSSEDRCLAVISHDGKKLDLCQFVVEHADQIMAHDRILATGTTGHWVRKFMKSMGFADSEVAKIKPYQSGPHGGDVQIARAVMEGRCRTVIFFEDPLDALPHEVDVRLFAQAVIESGNVRFATNASTARLLLARREAVEMAAGGVR